jgi:hypothetical protein
MPSRTRVRGQRKPLLMLLLLLMPPRRGTCSAVVSLLLSLLVALLFLFTVKLLPKVLLPTAVVPSLHFVERTLPAIEAVAVHHGEASKNLAEDGIGVEG